MVFGLDFSGLALSFPFGEPYIKIPSQKDLNTSWLTAAAAGQEINYFVTSVRGLEKGGDSSCRAFLEANGFKNYDLVDEAICAVLSLTGHAPVGDVALVLGLSGTTFSAALVCGGFRDPRVVGFVQGPGVVEVVDEVLSKNGQARESVSDVLALGPMHALIGGLVKLFPQARARSEVNAHGMAAVGARIAALGRMQTIRMAKNTSQPSTDSPTNPTPSRTPTTSALPSSSAPPAPTSHFSSASSSSSSSNPSPSSPSPSNPSPGVFVDRPNFPVGPSALLPGINSPDVPAAKAAIRLMLRTVDKFNGVTSVSVARRVMSFRDKQGLKPIAEDVLWAAAARMVEDGEVEIIRSRHKLVSGRHDKFDPQRAGGGGDDHIPGGKVLSKEKDHAPARGKGKGKGPEKETADDLSDIKKDKARRPVLPKTSYYPPQ